MALHNPLRRKMTYYQSVGVFDAILDLSEKGHTQTEIADELNRRGLKTQRGGRFCQSVISLLISQAQDAGSLPVL